MLEATPEGKSVLGQALALRGFMYLCLSENFCQGNYAVNKDTAPGVPVYTEPASLASDGNPRGKLVDVLSRAADDLDEAITVFDGAASQAHPSHIDRYTAYGLRARVAMVMGEWETVLTNANAALAKPGLTRVATVSDLGGNSDAGAKNVLWGFAVNAEDAAPFGGFLCYMDSENGNYASGGMQQLIDKRLYDLIPASDERKGAWWQGELDEDSDTYGVGLDVSYANKKFKFSNPATAEGDIINLRAAPVLTARLANPSHRRRIQPDCRPTWKLSTIFATWCCRNSMSSSSTPRRRKRNVSKP